jgi:PncC family amidohydrolase
VNLIDSAKSAGLRLAIAESLTGGQLTATLIDTPGASEVVLGGLVAYQDQLKEQLLGVSPQLIAAQTSVDAEVAAQMAQGVRQKLAQKCGVAESGVIGISTTGVAGPDAVGQNPVGTVFIGVASELEVKVMALQLQGDRAQIRNQATQAALEGLAEEIQRLAGY